jgi:hypothetical protein
MPFMRSKSRQRLRGMFSGVAQLQKLYGVCVGGRLKKEVWSLKILFLLCKTSSSECWIAKTRGDTTLF